MTSTDHEYEHKSGSPRYRSLSNFYNGDPARIDSRELDIGLWWRDDPSEPLHRAAWVIDTGELYLVRLGPPDAGGGEVEVLAVVEDREHLECVLEGWREECGSPGSLTWLRERAERLGDRLGARVRAAQLRMAASVGAAGVAISFAGAELFG